MYCRFVRDAFVVCDDETGERYEYLNGWSETVGGVQVVDLRSTGEDVFVFGDPLFRKLFGIIIIPDVSEALFQQLLYGGDA